MTQKTYLFAGASSKVAMEASQLLQAEGHKVVGISTKTDITGYDALYTVDNYDFLNFPALNHVVDGLVYFPGTITLKPFNRLAAKDFLNDYQVNALGAAAFVQAYLTNLKGSTSPAIVFISTVAVSVGMPFHASISMAKGALEGLTRSLAAELAPAVRVNCVAPSLTDTPLGEKFINTPEKLEASRNRNPLKKIGSPADLANAVSFLLSSKAGWITGQVIAVDGGMNKLKLL